MMEKMGEVNNNEEKIQSEENPSLEKEQKDDSREVVGDALSSMEKEYQDISKTFDTLEVNAENIKGEEGKELREEIDRLKKEAIGTVEWWTGQILAFTNVVVGEPSMFPPLPKQEILPYKETFDEMITRAKQEFAEKGVTSEQRETYKPIVNDLLARGVEPWGYNVNQIAMDFFPHLLLGKNDLVPIYRKREDAWRMYLGFPQKAETFEISDYRPNDTSVEYCYKLKNFFNDFFSKKSFKGVVSRLSDTKTENGESSFVDQDSTHFVMGGYSWHLGQDEKGSYVAYHDVWDLNVPIEKEKGFFGKPFTIYDRLYYDPETFEPIL